MGMKGWENYVPPTSREPGPVAKRSKYGAVKTTVDGITFDSAREAKRYTELRAMQRAGEISTLRRQQPYALLVGTVCIGHYVSDFDYVLFSSGERVIEDVKGMRTELYKWKKKHFEAQYGLKILESR